MKTIQVIGTQRSGTNLLRLILNGFDEISAPHPPHILKTFFPILSRYGDLEKSKNFKKLADDVVKWIDSNPVPWQVKLKGSEVYKKCRENSLTELFNVVYAIKANHDDACIWCCKSTFNVHYFKELESSNINPTYIHLYRDGRDVALSFRLTPIGPKHIYYAAQQWVEDQNAAMKIKEQVKPNRFISVKYENLITQPYKTIHRLCECLDLDYNPSALEYYKSQESKLTAQAGKMWENLQRPILSHNSGKYKSVLTNDEIEIFHNIAGEMIEKLGYNYRRLKVAQLLKENRVSDFKKIDQELRRRAFEALESSEKVERNERLRLLSTFGCKMKV